MAHWRPDIKLPPPIKETKTTLKMRKNVNKILFSMVGSMPTEEDLLDFAIPYTANIPIIRQTTKRHRELPAAGRRKHRKRYIRVLGTRRPANIENQYFTLFILTKEGLLNEIRVTDKL